ncbi:sugar ABC transporter permease [Nocardioides sp. S-58]|uniref:Sugar ABC transporter permease n=1 Tax=Nocardioides renjunii TaxID=3095075 RepID=A0ABU5K9R9_9ACTN|nr:sugar ABC transporter permease [Nocardioides sp. S-58]MDZ5661722.1 sugar ABC transporter permease [Nocardioides sp. S-58]
MSTSTQAAPAATPPTAGAPLPSGPGRTGPAGRSWRESLVGYAFVSPNLVLLVLFLFVPLVSAILMSFQDVSSFGPSSWVGIDNYRRLLSEDVFWRTLTNTLVFTLATVPTSIAIGLVLAVLLDTAVPARTVLRTIIFVPIVISGLVVALIGLLMFDEGVGMLNGMLAAVGIDDARWQTDGTLAMVSVVVMTVWTRVGFAMVIYLAALQDVPREIHEAAQVDGAGAVQRFWWVTVPMLSAPTFFLVVMNIIWSFQVFDIVYVMTGGGPGNDTEMLVTYAYDQGFGPTRDFGYGSTIGVVIFLLTLVVVVLRLHRERREARSGGVR